MSFRFKGRATAADPTGYYHPRWDQAEKVSVLADTKAEATTKALAMLGDSRHAGSVRLTSGGFGHSQGWAIIWDEIDEEAQK